MTLDLRMYNKILSTPGEIEGVAEVDVEGQWSSFGSVAALRLALPSVQLMPLQDLKNLTVQAEFTPSGSRVANIDALVASGKLTGTAEINLPLKQEDSQRLAYEGSIQLDALRTEQLLPIIDFPQNLLDVKADLNGKVQFSGNDLDLRKINLDGNLQLDDASLNGVPIRLSAAR